ncbi:TPA: hypothetical protein ACXDAY_002257 [Clostridium botulinum]|uniref:hypothetical protein n=1 Tax=Clostridium botulinum TaxID=1491 RepID=UPI0004B52B56|nr:hypothetical protein [Clostridium botulinum]APH20879.1 hypothetical protein NPD1_4113 [Clostridium botulinum]APQ71298.1 hypothetical protein RSJ8_4070 [Clostridium botulinum]MBN3352039.1 hypothetical protein [Clostridium botulinum]MBN3359181.1 hypothetical protein [Clostridium botulinum]MBN3379073.1 hypothetical protein [Clostridium botulinum]
MDIINGIEIYSISKEAYKTYKEQAKQGRNASSEIIRKKLTALVINAVERKRIFKNKFTCRFGGFVMVVNEDTKMIEVLFWDNFKTHKSTAPRKSVDNLLETYKKLGLSKSGDELLVA